MILEDAGGLSLRADRRTVWTALHDPASLRLCLPGCLALTRACETHFDLSVRVAFGPVAAVFDGEVDILASVPLRTLRLRGRGRGGVAGLAEGTVDITLTDRPDGCRLDYRLAAHPSGPVAVLGSLLLSGLARSLVDEFARTFAVVVGAQTRPTATATAPARPAAPAPSVATPSWGVSRRP